MRKIIAVLTIGLAGLLTGHGQAASVELSEQETDWGAQWAAYVPEDAAFISVSDYVRPADTDGADYAWFSSCAGDEVVILGSYTHGALHDSAAVIVGDYDGSGFLEGRECDEQSYANEVVSQQGR